MKERMWEWEIERRVWEEEPVRKLSSIVETGGRDLQVTQSKYYSESNVNDWVTAK